MRPHRDIWYGTSARQNLSIRGHFHAEPEKGFLRHKISLSGRKNVPGDPMAPKSMASCVLSKSNPHSGSCCLDSAFHEKNTRLKLSGPDYKDKDPKSALADFRRRIFLYQKLYVLLGPFAELAG